MTPFRVLTFCLFSVAAVLPARASDPTSTGTATGLPIPRDQMIEWVRTGVGPEIQPGVFIPRHLAYAGVFTAAFPTSRE